MKITIDTKTDSHEEIKKMISLLEALMGATHSTIIENQSTMDASPEMFSMFSNSNENKTEEKTEEKKPETFDVDDLLDN